MNRERAESETAGARGRHCPSCLSFAPPDATRCVQCGAAIETVRTRRVPVWAGIGVLLLGVGIAYGLGAFGNGRSSTTDAPSAGVVEEGNENEASPRAEALREPREDSSEPILALDAPTPPAPSRRASIEPTDRLRRASSPTPETTFALPDAVAEASSRLIAVQFFDRDGALWRESIAALVDDRGTAVVAADDLLGAYRARGFTASGALRAIDAVLAYEAEAGVAAVRLVDDRLGAAGPRGLSLADDERELETAAFVFAPGELGALRIGRGAVEPGDVPGRATFSGTALATSGIVLDAEGRLAGVLLPESDGAPSHRVAAAAVVDRVRRSASAMTIESFYVSEYEGTVRYHLDRAHAFLDAGRPVAALGEFASALRIDLRALEGEELALGAALLRALDEARATSRVAVVLGPIETLLRYDGAPSVVWIHAGRLYLDLARYEDAVRWLGLAARSSTADLDAIRPFLLRAYREWVRELIASGRFVTAIDVLARALDELGNDAQLLFELGRAHMGLQQYNLARIAMEDALSVDPGMVDVIGPLLDEIYRHLGDDGVLTIDIPSDTRLIPVDVWLNRRTHSTLYIDSGASWTFITRDLALSLGIDPDRTGRHARFSTANGTVDLPVVVLDEVNFRGFTVRNVEAGIGNLGPTLGGGVLGNNFLRHFKITIDRPRGKMTISDPR